MLKAGNGILLLLLLVSAGVIHHVLADYNQSLMNGGPMPKDDLVDNFRRQFLYDADYNNVLFKDESERLFLFNTGQKLVETYHQRMQKAKPSEVEMEFRLPVIDFRVQR